MDWALVFRAAEQRLKMRRWEIARYTLSQLLNALKQDSGEDEGIPISSLDELDALVGLG